MIEALCLSILCCSDGAQYTLSVITPHNRNGFYSLQTSVEFAWESTGGKLFE